MAEFGSPWIQKEGIRSLMGAYRDVTWRRKNEGWSSGEAQVAKQESIDRSQTMTDFGDFS